MDNRKTTYEQMTERALGTTIEALLREWEASGESGRSYSRKIGIPEKTLRNWRSKYFAVRTIFELREPVGSGSR